MIIFESVASQKAITEVSNEIMKQLRLNLEYNLTQPTYETPSVNTVDMNFNTSEKKLNELLADGIIVQLSIRRNPDYAGVWKGTLTNPNANQAGYIELVLDATKLESKKQIIPAFQMKYSDFTSTLAHELTHAYDNYRSGDIDPVTMPSGDVYNGAKGGYMDKRFIDAARDGREDEHHVYQNYSHEINARYTQAIMHTRSAFAMLKTVGSGSFISRFKTEFDGWDNIPPEEQKRLLARAGAEFVDFQKNFKGKESDVAKAFRGKKVNYDVTVADRGYLFTKLVTTEDPRSIIDSLESLAIKTNGIVSLTFDSVKDTPLSRVLSNKIRQGTWDRQKEYILYIP